MTVVKLNASSLLDWLDSKTTKDVAADSNGFLSLNEKSIPPYKVVIIEGEAESILGTLW